MRSLCIIFGDVSLSCSSGWFSNCVGSLFVKESFIFTSSRVHFTVRSALYFSLPSDSEYVGDITFKQDSEFPLTFTNLRLIL